MPAPSALREPGDAGETAPAPADGAATAPPPPWLPASIQDCPAMDGCPAGMALVPGGTGSYGWYVCPFCLDITEVTVDAYAQCVAGGTCTEPDRYQAMYRRRWLCNWKHRPDARPAHPVNCVSLIDGRAYCAWAGKRLPSRTERTWAAAGGAERRLYPWGDGRPGPFRVNGCGEECIEDLRQHGIEDWPGIDYPDRDAFPGTAPVGSFPGGIGRWGHADLSGNVSEYVDYEVPEACGGNFVFNLFADVAHTTAFASDACVESVAPDWRSFGHGFRCASGGRPVRLDAQHRPVAY